jgi:hypothetical protein
MLTLTCRPPREFAASTRQVPPLHLPVGRSCGPSRARGRTRRDVLHMLVGADSGRFPYIPRRRPVR